MPEKQKQTYRVMPHNPEAEEALLGSILIDPRAADQLIPTLRAADFYETANATIFDAMRALLDSSVVVDAVSVADRLMVENKLDEVGGMDYIASLTESIPSSAGAEHYADIVKRDSLIRRVISAGNKIVQEGYKSVSGTDALLAAEHEVYAISEDITEKNLVLAKEALGDVMQSIQDAQAGVIDTDAIYTDFPSLDKMSHGFKPGELILVAARPSVGKTAFALNIAANACLKHNKTVAIFSLEMPAQLLVKRLLAHISQCSISLMDTKGGLSDAATGKVYDAYRRLHSAQLYIDDFSMNTPSDVLSKCRRLKRDHGLDMIIIDYLQLMSAGNERRAEESRQVEVSVMSRLMKIYAKELGVPVILLSQMSRGVEQRTDHTPKLSDLRESGAIEQDADMVMFLHRESQFNAAIPDNLVKLIVGKNRNGERGEVEMQWDGGTMTFCELKDGETPAGERAAAPAQPRPDYRAPAQSAAEEDDDAFEKEEETDEGPLPWEEAAKDGVPVPAPAEEGDEEDVSESEEEKLADEEYREEYAAEDPDDEEEYVDSDDFEDGEVDDDLPY